MSQQLTHFIFPTIFTLSLHHTRHPFLTANTLSPHICGNHSWTDIIFLSSFPHSYPVHASICPELEIETMKYHAIDNPTSNGLFRPVSQPFKQKLWQRLETSRFGYCPSNLVVSCSTGVCNLECGSKKSATSPTLFAPHPYHTNSWYLCTFFYPFQNYASSPKLHLTAETSPTTYREITPISHIFILNYSYTTLGTCSKPLTLTSNFAEPIC